MDMWSQVVTLSSFFKSPDFEHAIIERSLAEWQNESGMHIDEPLANPPYSIALCGGSWTLITIDQLAAYSTSTVVRIPVLDTSNLANILNHTGTTERLYFKELFLKEKENLKAQILKKVSSSVEYCEGEFSLQSTRDGWQAVVYHPKIKGAFLLGDFSTSEEAAKAAIDYINKQ